MCVQTVYDAQTCLAAMAEIDLLQRATSLEIYPVNFAASCHFVVQVSSSRGERECRSFPLVTLWRGARNTPSDRLSRPSQRQKESRLSNAFRLPSPNQPDMLLGGSFLSVSQCEYQEGSTMDRPELVRPNRRYGSRYSYVLVLMYVDHGELMPVLLGSWGWRICPRSGIYQCRNESLVREIRSGQVVEKRAGATV